MVNVSILGYKYATTGNSTPLLSCHLCFQIRCAYYNTLATENNHSTLIISKPATGYDPKSVPLTLYPKLLTSYKPILKTFKTVSKNLSNSKSFVKYRSYTKCFLALCPTPKLVDHLLLAVCDLLFSLYRYIINLKFLVYFRVLWPPNHLYSIRVLHFSFLLLVFFFGFCYPMSTNFINILYNFKCESLNIILHLKVVQ
jgi:hypothetical protein